MSIEVRPSVPSLEARAEKFLGTINSFEEKHPFNLPEKVKLAVAQTVAEVASAETKDDLLGWAGEADELLKKNSRGNQGRQYNYKEVLEHAYTKSSVPPTDEEFVLEKKPTVASWLVFARLGKDESQAARAMACAEYIIKK